MLQNERRVREHYLGLYYKFMTKNMISVNIAKYKSPTRTTLLLDIKARTFPFHFIMYYNVIFSFSYFRSTLMATLYVFIDPYLCSPVYPQICFYLYVFCLLVIYLSLGCPRLSYEITSRVVEEPWCSVSIINAWQ